ncbi:MAG: DUF1080 domain-containing protein [Planctomycetota bacterium]|nr:MAG: DUF1080 domain-containing protein [Planctomycetota bacterium]
MRHPLRWIMASAAVAVGAIGMTAEWKSGINWDEPRLVDTSQPVPSDAKILFAGENMDAWNGVKNWVFEKGYAQVGSTVHSKEKFGDCQLHLEFATPEKVEGNGQGRGNSGIYFMNRYEVQILDSHENPTYFDGQCASIYKQRPPLVNACRKPGEWQTYDIVFHAPKFLADGSLKSPATVTVLQNGVLVQDHFELQGATAWDAPPAYSAHDSKDTLSLQFHGNPTRFRNIWVREL